MTLRALVLFALLSTFAPPARADFVFGPFTVPSNGSVDVVTQVDGSPWNTVDHGYLDGIDYHVRGTYSFSEVFASTFDDIIYLGAADVPTTMTFEARFTDNLLVNGPGADLILLDSAIEGVNGYDVAIESTNGFTDFVSYPSNLAVDINRAGAYWWFQPVGGALLLMWLEPRAIAIDLSDFGLAEGHAVTSFRFRGHAGADPLGAAALHTALPVPAQATTWGAVKALYR